MKRSNNSYAAEDSKQRTRKARVSSASSSQQSINKQIETKMKQSNKNNYDNNRTARAIASAIEQLPTGSRRLPLIGKTMVIRYMDSEPIELIPLEMVCENVQKRNSFLYSDGVWETTRKFRPVAQLGMTQPTVIHKQEFAIVMRSVAHVTMEQVRSAMINACDTQEQLDMASCCEISLLSDQQAENFDVYAKSFDDEMAEVLWSDVQEHTDSYDDAIEQFYMEMIEESSACQCRWAKFFASRGHWYMAATLMACAAEDNYNPAVERLKAIAW